MLDNILNFFKKENSKPKPKTLKQQLLSLPLGSYDLFDLNPEICLQHIQKGIDRFDSNVLNNNQLKGLIKAVYISENIGHVYIEVVGLVVNGEFASRKDYVVMETEITNFSVIG